MKSIKSDGKCEAEVVYPCLMKLDLSPQYNEGLVVLRFKAGVGTVVYQGEFRESIGYYSGTWNKNFYPYNGSICLEN